MGKGWEDVKTCGRSSGPFQMLGGTAPLGPIFPSGPVHDAWKQQQLLE